MVKNSYTTNTENFLSTDSQFQEIVTDYTFVNPNIGKMYGNRIVFKTTFSDSLLFKLENAFNSIEGCLSRLKNLLKRDNIGRFPSDMRETFEKEVFALIKGIDDTAYSTESNGIKLLNGQRKNIILTNNNSDSNFVAIGEEIFGDFEINVINLLNKNWLADNLFEYINSDFDRAIEELNEAISYIEKRIIAIKACREQIAQKTIDTSIRKINKKEEDTKLIDIQIEIIKNAKKSILTAAGKNLSYNVVFGE